MTRSKGSKKDNYYFTKEHEEAILKYVASTDHRERQELYSKVISPIFNDLIKKVVYTYKFTNIPNSEQLMEDCGAHLSMIIDKFDPEKAKAFTYFTVVIKNFFFAEKKKQIRQLQTESCFEDLSIMDEEGLHESHQYDEVREKHEFWNALIDELKFWEADMAESSSDLLVYRAFKILVDHVENIEVMNKRVAYQHLRRLTGLDTKSITAALNKITENYSEFKNAWDQGEI